MKKIIIILAALSSFSASAEESQDPQHFAQHVNNNYENIKQQVCSQLDLSVNISASPFLYTDPEASCDLGFKMPGLPDFNLGFEGLDSCSLLKSVTGELVSQVNQEMRDVVNGGLESVGLEDGTIDIDFGDLVIDEIEGNP